MVGGLANIQKLKAPYGISGENYLKKLYSYPEFRASFDAVAFHPYAEKVEGMIRAVDGIRKVMDSNGDSSKSIYITEVGWSTHGGKDDKSLVVSPQQQADNLTSAMNWFKK